MLGYSTSLLSFALQAPLASFCSRVTGFWRVVVMDMFTAVAYVGSVNVWRGLWNLYDLYLLPGALTEQVAIGHLSERNLFMAENARSFHLSHM